MMTIFITFASPEFSFDNFNVCKDRIKQASYYIITVRWCVWFGLQGQGDLLRGAKMDSLDSLRQLALACEACGLTSCSSSNSSSSAFSAEHYYSSQPLPGRRSSSHGNGRVWCLSRCERRKADGGRAHDVNVCVDKVVCWFLVVLS